jgi:hypothetical protein
MRVSSLTVDPFTSTPIVVLKDASGSLSVPIWIGLVEASAIATELDHIQLDRPMTHDLMTALVKTLDARVERIDIHDLRDHTFYATLHVVDAAGRPRALDARPSDAIAVALRTGAPIFVARKVIERARRIDLRVEPDAPDLRRMAMPAASQQASAASETAPRRDERIAGLLESLSEGAFGKWKM